LSLPQQASGEASRSRGCVPCSYCASVGSEASAGPQQQSSLEVHWRGGRRPDEYAVFGMFLIQRLRQTGRTYSWFSKRSADRVDCQGCHSRGKGSMLDSLLRSLVVGLYRSPVSGLYKPRIAEH